MVTTTRKRVSKKVVPTDIKLDAWVCSEFFPELTTSLTCTLATDGRAVAYQGQLDNEGDRSKIVKAYLNTTDSVSASLGKKDIELLVMLSQDGVSNAIHKEITIESHSTHLNKYSILNGVAINVNYLKRIAKTLKAGQTVVYRYNSKNKLSPVFFDCDWFGFCICPCELK